MSDDDCIFCRIASGDPGDQVFYADEDSVAFLDIAPATRGHTLVLPRRHSADIFSVPEAEFAALGRAVHRVAQRLEERLRPDGLTIFQSNRVAGWQDVFHLHVHLVPRYDDDGLIRPWTTTTERPDEISQLTAALR